MSYQNNTYLKDRERKFNNLSYSIILCYFSHISSFFLPFYKIVKTPLWFLNLFSLRKCYISKRHRVNLKPEKHVLLPSLAGDHDDFVPRVFSHFVLVAENTDLARCVSDAGLAHAPIPLLLLLLRSKLSQSGTFAFNPFFTRPLPKAGRELQTVLNTRRIMEGWGGPLAKNDRSPGRESTQRLCTCFLLYTGCNIE